MALDASAEELAPLVAEYYAATAGARAAALATALEWGGACVRREPWVLELLDTPMTGREPVHIEAAGQRGRGAGQDAVWASACEGDESSPLCALFRRLQAVYAHRVTLRSYNYNGCHQLQVDVGDDQIFFGWKLHLALGGVAPLYRGMVVQYDGFEPPPLDVVMATADAHAWGADVALSTAMPPTSLPGARVLGIAKLKCLNYLIRTFGVRNQLGMLIDRGAAAYVAATERFLKIWGVPTEHHERLRTTFSQWASEVALLGEGERRTLHNGEYLEWLEPFLKGERRSAATASFGLERFLLLIVNLTGAALPPEIARDYAPGMTPCRMHDAHQLARAGSVMVLEHPPSGQWLSGRQFQDAAGTPTLVLLFPPRADAETKWHKMLAVCESLVVRFPQLNGRVLVAPSADEWRVAVQAMAAALPPSPSEMLAAHMAAAVAAAQGSGSGGAAAAAAAAAASAAAALAGAPAAPAPLPERLIRTVVVLLALPPGGGKSTFYDALRRAGAAVASSDDERVRGGNFDAVLASLLQKHELVGYDKNVPNADGLAKFFKVLSSVENAHRIAVRVIPVVPAYLDHDVAWARVGARTASHHALNIHTSAGGESEAYNVFKNIFFDACTAFQPQAAQLPGAIVSDAFWVSLEATHALAAHVCEQVPLATPLATLRSFVEGAAIDAAAGGSGGGGGGGAWACAEIPATKLHVTLVPPAGALAHERGAERERAAALRRLRPLANKGVCVHVQRYILAKAKPLAADLPSARAGEKRSGHGSTTERRVAFWEVSAIDGLPAALQFKLQQEIYHVTDTASLVGCAPRDAAEVLRALRSGDLSPEWDVTSIGPTTPAEVFAQVRIVS